MFAFIRAVVNQWLLDQKTIRLLREQNEAVARATFGENWEWFRDYARRAQVLIPYSWPDWWDVALMMGRYTDTSTLDGEEMWMRRLARIIDRCSEAGWPPDPHQIARIYAKAYPSTFQPPNQNQGDPGQE